jgi:glycosyltransferase involved in cell wall biosynthesis
VPAGKLVVHYIGIDVKRFSASFDLRDRIVLFVGRLVEKKGCEYLLRAMTRVRARSGSARLVIIGDGPLRPSLERLAQTEDCGATFLGPQNHAVVREWMNRAAVLALPSVTASNGDTEGLPIVLLEGIASGLPVVATHHAGIPEAITHGENGYLVPERDIDGLATYLHVLLSDSDHARSIARAGRRVAERRFSLTRQCELLDVIYDDALRGTSPPFVTPGMAP